MFVSQPSGYSVGKDAFSTPRFYRDLGQLADGAETTADFALTPAPASRSNDFTFANIADPHANPANPLRSSAAWRNQMAEINSTAQHRGFVQVSGEPYEPAVHEGYEWIHTLSGRMHLVLGPGTRSRGGRGRRVSTLAPRTSSPTTATSRPRYWRSSGLRASRCTFGQGPDASDAG